MKEEFCPPCLAAIPLAFAATSTGASAAIDDGSNHDNKKAKLKRTLFLIGITVGSIALSFLFIWFIFFKNKCTTCK